MSENDRPTITVSLTRKINLGNYESADAFMAISGIEANMTPDEINALLDTGYLAWDLMGHALADKVKEMRAEAQDDGLAFEEGEPTPIYRPPSHAEVVEQRQAAAPSAPAGVLTKVRCQFCQGQVWDNREDKRSAKGPDFKCRDKDCGAAAWVQKDGELRWVEGRS